MQPKLWQAALAAALLAAGCGLTPSLTKATGPEQAAPKAPVLVPTAETKQQRLRRLNFIPICPPDGFPDGNMDGLADGIPPD